MSIADKITSIEEHLTDDYEGLENLGDDLTNVNKNIQNIRTCLDNIYSSLPKTTGEGSNLSLTTLKGRINVDDILGDTTQEGTPTPDSPQDIEVVTGEQEVVVEGTNILPITLAKIKELNSSNWTWNNNVGSRNGLDFTINDDLSIKVSGTASANTYLDLTGELTYKANTYTFTGTPSTRK